MKIISFGTTTAPQATQTQPTVQAPLVASIKKKPFTDNFYTKIKNSADMTDTVSVPRTVFKGYLAFMGGAFLTTIGANISNYNKALSTGLNIAGLVSMIYGTFSFVRPYIFKDIKGVTK